MHSSRLLNPLAQRLTQPPGRLEWLAWTGALIGALVGLGLSLPQVMANPGVWALSLGAYAVLLWVLVHHEVVVGLAGRVTLVRALITLLLLGVLWAPEAYREYGFGLGLMGLVALLLDGLDGHVARRRGETTDAGARFDMETDAAMILVLSLAVWLSDRAGVWVLAMGALRYMFVASAWRWSWMAKPLPESMRRKVICVVQVSMLLLVLPTWLPAPMALAVLVIGLALLLYSFGVDTLWLWRHRKQEV